MGHNACFMNGILQSNESLKNDVVDELKYEPSVDEAERAAWAAGGVTNVENLLVIDGVED
jgi:hypothetical protein